MPVGVPKLSEKDRRELEKFVKNFLIKCIQVILQSRYDEPEKTACKPRGSSADWFHLNVPDVGEFSDQIKSVMNLIPQKSLTIGSTICVDLSLCTKEEKLVLETWEITMLADVDPSAKSTYEVYCRMGILLKSLVAISRIVPAYRLAVSQNDDYRLHYLIYVGPAPEDNCGEDSKVIHVGKVGMQNGTISVSVRYRTKLVYGSKEKQDKTDKLMVKSNYFPEPLIKDQKDGARDVHGNRFDLGFPINTNRNQKNKSLNECSPYGAFASQVQEPELEPDLGEMFCNLLLDPDETIPIDFPERPESPSELKFYDEDYRSADNEDSSDKYVYVDLKPAFAEHSSDLGIFFLQAPPPLKSLSELNNDDTQNKENSETLVKQVEQMNAEIEKQQFDQFFDQVCGAEA